MEIFSNFKSYLLETNNNSIPQSFSNIDFSRTPEKYPDDLKAFFRNTTLAPLEYQINWDKVFQKGDTSSILQTIVDKGAHALDLSIDWPANDVLEEFNQFSPSEYVMNCQKGMWEMIPLHGYKHNPNDMRSHVKLRKLGYEGPIEWTWTEFAKRCPKTVDWIKNDPLYKTITRCGFMILEPGSFVFPHSDYSQPRLMGINYALTHPKECYWVMDQVGQIDFKPGSSMLLDYSPKHSVLNLSNQKRVHLLRGGTMDLDYLMSLIKKTFL